jgi:hypothetical protein
MRAPAPTAMTVCRSKRTLSANELTGRLEVGGTLLVVDPVVWEVGGRVVVVPFEGFVVVVVVVTFIGRVVVEVTAIIHETPEQTNPGPKLAVQKPLGSWTPPHPPTTGGAVGVLIGTQLAPTQVSPVPN